MVRLKRGALVPLITCEHASWALPARYGSLGLPLRLLRSHIAWDQGARDVARALARRHAWKYIEGRYSRLLVDLNRGEHNPRVIPAVAFAVAVPGNRAIADDEMRRRIESYWRPHRNAVERAVLVRAASGCCLHLAIHSFTPVLGGKTRLCDVGLLFDPRRSLERRIAAQLRTSLRASGLSVRFNYPYRGTADGLTTALRGRIASRGYAGIEIELNQSRLGSSAHRVQLVDAIDCGVDAARLAVAGRG